MPLKCKSGGRKRHQNGKVTAKSALIQSRVKKVWWHKVPSKHESGGTKRWFLFLKFELNNIVVTKYSVLRTKWWHKNHHISNCGGTLTTTYHISGAGTPAKTKKMETLMAFIFFREKVRLFPHLAKPAKPVNTTFRKDEKAMVQIKRDWFNTEIFVYERGWHYGRWKEKIQV